MARKDWTLAAVGVVVTAAVIAVAGWVVWNFTLRGPSTKEVASWVKQDMQTYMVTNPKMRPYHVQIGDVTLIKTGDVKYEGVAEVWTTRSSERNIPITVTYDGDKGMWQAGAGAFLFLATEGLPAP